MVKLKIAVLASGRGTDFQSVIDAAERGDIDVEIAVLVTNNPEALAIKRAKDHRIPYRVVEHRGRGRREFEDDIASVMREFGVDLIVLAGFMRILSSWFVNEFKGMMINIHPSLLPSFPGAHAHRDALRYGVRVSGCTIHFVTDDVDGGPVIVQKAVEVLPGDTEDALERRVLAEEHKLLPHAIRLFAEGRLKLEGRKVRIIGDDAKKP